MSDLPRGRTGWAGPTLPSVPLFCFTDSDPTVGGRGHQVHKSWSSTVSDPEVVLDPSLSSGEWAALCPEWGGKVGTLPLRPGARWRQFLFTNRRLEEV